MLAYDTRDNRLQARAREKEAPEPLTRKAQASIEALVVWTYRDQKADRMTDLALLEAERSAAGMRDYRSTRDGSIAAERAGRLLATVVFPPRVLGALHADAEAIHDAVSRMPGGYLLAMYGRRASRPDWVEVAELGLVPAWKDAPRYDAAGMPAEGSFRVIYTATRKASFCPLELAADPAYVRAQRREYGAWRAGLLSLRNAYRSQGGGIALLRAYSVTEELPPAEPWRSHQSRAELLLHTRD